MAIQLRKKSGNVWEVINTDTNTTFTSSKQFMTSNQNQVTFKEPWGNSIVVEDVSTISVFDDTDTGAEETYPTVSQLASRLKQLKNPSFPQECDGDVNGGTP